MTILTFKSSSLRGVTAMEKSNAFDLGLFLNPPIEFHPYFAWVWNSKVDRETIKSQLTDFYNNGVRCFYVLPMPNGFRPDAGLRTHLDMPYPGEEFFNLVAYAADLAEELGMVMWLYDEGGWPSGGACGKVLEMYPDAKVKELAERKPGDGDTEPLAMFDSNGSRVYSNDHAKYEYFINERGGGNLNFVNLLDPLVTKAFIECTYEGYKKHLGRHLGKTVRLIFTDEPQAAFPAWTRDFDKLFREKYGYDILDYLPYICGRESCKTEAQKKARIDYSHLCAELFDRNFLAPLQQWCRENGILFGGHLDGEHSPSRVRSNGYGSFTSSLSRMDVPGVDAIWRQIFPHSNGRAISDEVETSFFPRYASSASHINGSETALSETFSVYSTGLTQEEMRYTVNYQLIRGINLFNFMSLVSGRDRGLMYGMRPHFLPQKPGWDSVAQLCTETARLSYVASCGKSGIRTALYFPEDDFLIGESDGKSASESFNRLGEELEDAGIEFDIIGNAEILSSTAKDKSLSIGEAVYDTVFIPHCSHMPEHVKNLLAAVNCENEVNRKSEISADESKLRLMSRICGEERLVFVYNESTTAVTSRVHLNADGNIYVLDPATGLSEAVKSDTPEITLQSGRCVVYLITNRTIDVPNICKEKKTVLCSPVPLSAKRFVINEGKVKNIDIPFSEMKLDKYSGSVAVRFDYTLDSVPNGDYVILETDIIGYSVSMTLNGKKLGAMSASPKRLCVKAEEFPKSGNIVLTVENTEACEIVAKIDELLRDFGAEMRLYHDKNIAFEKDYIARLPKLDADKIKLYIG